jgi:hypothetical protein
MPKDRVSLSNDYCPYCNLDDRKEMTDEHVIPEEIGGRADFTIRVCKRCNNQLGTRVDSKLTRHVGLRFMAMRAGCYAKRNDRLESLVVLQDGTSLFGHSYWEELPSNGPTSTTRKFRVAFDPKPHQPDGTRWLSEMNPNAAHATSKVRILRENMIARTVLPFDSGAGVPIQPAMLKIVLGAIHYTFGPTVSSLSAFDIVRASIAGRWDSKIASAWTSVVPPVPCEENCHLVWFSCEDGTSFEAGVILWSKVASRFSISDFRVPLESKAISIRAPIRWKTIDSDQMTKS